MPMLRGCATEPVNEKEMGRFPAEQLFRDCCETKEIRK
jgi:hypothetical protein